VSSFLPPEHARLPTSPRRRAVHRALLVAATATIVAAIVAAIAWWLGVWGGYEHQLRVAVRDIGNCEGTSINHDGWGGATAALNAPASARFAAFCEELGPSVTWLHFRSAAAMRQAMAADARDRYPLLTRTTVCISSSRAELVAFDDVDHWKVRLLCWLRDASIVRQPAR
jgi:hypothetical protein